MAIGNDKRDVGKWDLVKPTTAPGRGRPDAQQNEQQRETNASLRKGQAVPQAPVGKVPIKDEKPAVRVGQQPPPPTERPVVSEQAPVVGLPEGAGHETTAPSTPAPQQRPSTEAMEQAVRAGKQAFKALSDLAQGGANKVVQQVRTGVLSSQEKFRDALISQFTLGSKPQLQTGNEKTLVKERPAAQIVKDAEGKVRQPGERVGAAKVAEAVAQQNPFAADVRVAQSEKRETKEDIKTDRRAAERLGSVTEGVARGIVAASGTQEFSGGSYSGGFGDPSGESAGLAGKVGAAPQIHVYGEPEIYVETEALYANLGLTRVLYGQEELRERVNVSISERISNTRDDVPLSERMGDARYVNQTAKGFRGSVDGPNKMRA